jgi:hypothetical protein
MISSIPPAGAAGLRRNIEYGRAGNVSLRLDTHVPA